MAREYRFLSFVAALLTCLCSLHSVRAQSQDYPSKIVRIVVPFVAGGGLDGIARLLAGKLQDEFKQTVLVENRGGQAGNLGAAFVAKSPADGYTMLITTSGFTVAPSLWSNLRYDTIKDFQPLTMLAESAIWLAVDPKLPVKNLAELIALAKSKPGGLNYGSSGFGNPLHLAMEMFMRQTDTKFVMVPFTNDAQIITAMTGGDVHVSMIPFLISRPHVESGALRALGFTRSERWPMSPATPTLAEQGLPGFDTRGWQGLLLPAGTPRDIVDKLYSTIKGIMATDDMKRRYDAFGSMPLVSSPDEFARRVVAEVEHFKKITQQIGLTPKAE